MEQSELRKLEHLCIQEEWAYCRAACPLHIDARSLCQALAEGDVNKARTILEKTMPIAGILGRICEAPCELECKRSEADGAVRIGLLEQFCVKNASRRGKPMKVPDRGRYAAVLGCGISGLTVAHDLARKGYRIQVYYPESDAEPQISLEKHLPGPVEQSVLTGEIAHLKKIGVHFIPAKCDRQLLAELLEKQTIVYVGIDAMDAGILPSPPDQRDPVTLGTPDKGVFIGGFPDGSAAVRAIDAACEGRRAAVSIDRLTQNASLYADRGREGPVPTRLVTSLEGVETAAPVLADGMDAGKPSLVQKEAARCLSCECMVCVRDCVYLEVYGAYPKSYARQIYNNESIVKGTRKANPLINSCMLCGLCTALCPNDFPMADLCLGARQRMVQGGKMPPSAHDFALKDLEFSRSDAFFMVCGDPDHDRCQWLFFPGCQLCATHPEQVADTYAWLRQNLAGGVGIALACCGAPAHWSGRQQIFTETAENLTTETEKLGHPRWIMACPSCQQTLGQLDSPPSQVSLWEIFSREGLKPPSPKGQKNFCLVDPCSASDLPLVRQATRHLARNDATGKISEPRLNADVAACCGYGGLLANVDPNLAKRAAERRATECQDDALTYCAMCREQIARSGHRAAHILDLFFPHADDPFERPAAGLSESRMNRRRLKNELLKAYWREAGTEPPDYLSIALQMSGQTRQLLETRRILDSDIQQVLAAAEPEGQQFYDPDSETYLSSRRLGDVTFWVHHAQQTDGRQWIYTAYSHRMVIGKISRKD
ncbi:MAG: 4Fe-4S dicluster domain-containing protein [Desulfobacteraceae bacterium]|nr:4Fe-4S dicluster domain-containing protein [Desulfobacteraceae bacterium]